MEFDQFMNGLIRRNPAQEEFHQAVYEFAEVVLPYMARHPEYKDKSILERMTEPDRIISFRVCWEDDQGRVRANRGYRVQFNNAIGPYKGGLRFRKTVRLSTLKFLAFEQTFKNALTTLPLGGAKGGSDFDSKDRSEAEIMRFCHSFMTELHHYIGKDKDIPAGDIGVGAREISYLFGQYKRLTNEFTGTLTGKGLTFGGSPIRTEATGYGCVYFAGEMLKTRGESIEGKTCAISGSGNVAMHTVEKLIELGAKVVTLSDSSGFIHDSQGVDKEKLEYVIDLKNNKRGRIKEYADRFKCKYYAGKKPWGIKCDMAFPSATQNEIDEKDAKALLKNGCCLIAEGANMPSTREASNLFRDHKILYGPSKAANAGGVAISGLEMAQNSMHLTWTREKVDEELCNIMKKIHDQCVAHGQEGKYINYVKGANIASFIKVAETMLAYGIL